MFNLVRVTVTMPLIYWALFGYLATVMFVAAGVGLVIAVKIIVQRKLTLKHCQDCRRPSRLGATTHNAFRSRGVVIAEDA
jgi:hypothetical protein